MFFKTNCSKYENECYIYEELRLASKNRGTKSYKSMSKDKLLSLLNAPELIIENKTIRNIRNEN